jgi:hypothetical protein
MYDTGAITRDEVTKSLREEEKRMEDEQRRLEEEEDKKRRKPPQALGGASGGNGSGISSGSGAGEGGSGGGGMSSIWNRLFSTPASREDESLAFQISDPSNFRKIDADLAQQDYAASLPPPSASSGSTPTPPTAGGSAGGGEASNAAAAPGFGRGITVGTGGWMKKSGISIASMSSGVISAPVSQSSGGPALGGARAASQPTHPYTASSIPSPSSSGSSSPNTGHQPRSREPSSDGQDLLPAGDYVSDADESEARSSKLVHEGTSLSLSLAHTHTRARAHCSA